MNILFRVDASEAIGTGHLIRCLTLANQLKIQGMSTRFICRHLPSHLHSLLISSGHEVRMLKEKESGFCDDLAHSSWLSVSQETDAAQTISELSDLDWDWVIGDHYGLDIRWDGALRPLVKKILVIDDLADRSHDCDLLLDQNFYIDMNSRYAGKVPDSCALLLGPKYALLREEFRISRLSRNSFIDKVKRVIVFFGGIDALNYTGKTIDVLAKLNAGNFYVDVVIGLANPHRQSIEILCRQAKFNCYIQTEKISELMVASDLAIGAGGVSIWERCCLGLPSIVIATANNQIKQISDAAKVGFVYSPDINGNYEAEIASHIFSLIHNKSFREFISKQGYDAVDGAGTGRVIRLLTCGQLKMRRAALTDSDQIYQWRNHEKIRLASRNKDLIKKNNHDNWFLDIINNTNKLVLIGESSNSPIGVVRFDINNREAEVSIYLVPEAGIFYGGVELLKNAEEWLRNNYKEIDLLKAHVLSDNKKSHNLFIKSGYLVDSIHYLKKVAK